MDEKVFDIGLEEIWRRIQTDSLSKEFVVFDNLKGSFGGIDLMDIFEISRYPMRLNLNMIIFCKEGHLRIKVGVTEYLLAENMFIILLTNQIFQVIDISPDFKAGFILLKDGYLLEQNDIRTLIWNIGKALVWKSCYTLPKEVIEEEDFLFRSIKRAIRQKENPYREELVRHYFRIMIYQVCHVFIAEQEKISKTNSRQDDIFYQFMKNVSENFYRQRQISFYAGKAALSPKYFSRIILDVSRKKAADWIKEYVILEAKTLLKNTSMTVQEISDKLNFSTQSHFSRYFAACTNVSPNEYRRQ